MGRRYRYKLHHFEILDNSDFTWFIVNHYGTWKIKDNLLTEKIDSSKIIDVVIPKPITAEYLVEAVSFGGNDLNVEILELTEPWLLTFSCS